MKRYTHLLLCALAAALPSCVTVSAELALPGSGRDGALSGKIGGSWSWPSPRPPATEPPLPSPEDETAAILSNGRIHPAFGAAGGSPGAVGINRVLRVDG
jgi:hypothetical protein